jgi:hypothetical protein
VTTRLIATVGSGWIVFATTDGRTSTNVATQRVVPATGREVVAATNRVAAELGLSSGGVTIRSADRNVLDEIAAVLDTAGLAEPGHRRIKLALIDRPPHPGSDLPPRAVGPAVGLDATPAPAAVGNESGADKNSMTRRWLVGAGGATLIGAAVSTYLVANNSSAHEVGASGAGPDAGSPATIPVDELGLTDNERIERLNVLAQRSAGKSTPVYEFANRTYAITTPIKLFSGLKLRGTGGLPAREYGGGTVIAWEGDDDSSVFVFPPEGQSGQNYPTDGSPRDISISGLMFEGGASTNVFPRLSMSSGSHVGHTLWYSSLHNLGVRAMRTFWWGYGTGVSLSGSFHAQALADTPLYLGGSENTIFGTSDQSFMDNSTASWRQSGKAFIRSVMSKSYIGRVIITARSDSFHLSVEGGRGLVVDGVQFDAAGSDQSRNAAIKVSDINGLTVSNCVFYGTMSQPGDGSRGIVDIRGGSGVLMTGNQFVRILGDREADSVAASPGTPLIYNATPDPVKLGMNGFPDFDGIVVGNAITSDPTVKVRPL